MEEQPLHNEEEKWEQPLPFTRVAHGIDQDALWDRIQGSVTQEQARPRIRRLVPLSLTTAAAAALALLWIFVFSGPGRVQMQAPLAQNLETRLPDQSAVILNAGSQISFSEKKWEQERTVQLRGEAFFQVRKGAVFTVETDVGTVRVLGTQFNVFARDDRFRVTCTEGSVSVSSANEQVAIGAGEAAFLTSAGQLEVINAPAPTWRDGVFVFDSEPLSNVLEEIERQFDLQVRIDPGLASEPVTTRFERGKLEEALEKIAYTLDLSYRQENGVVRFYSE